jgi:hypothetical protein
VLRLVRAVRSANVGIEPVSTPHPPLDSLDRQFLDLLRLLVEGVFLPPVVMGTLGDDPGSISVQGIVLRPRRLHFPACELDKKVC